MITYFPLIFLRSWLGTDNQGSKILVTSSGCWGFSEALEVRVPLLWAFQQAVHRADMEMNLSRPIDSHNLNLETFPSCSRTILLEIALIRVAI